MKKIDFYLDFISPYSWLGFDALPTFLSRTEVEVSYRPILFAALLKHYGQLGPAEIPAKRNWTYREVLWRAREQKTSLRLPAQHPFNPLELLRLSLACCENDSPSRDVCDIIFRHVWCSGLDPCERSRIATLNNQLKPVRDPSSLEVKRALQKNSEEAIGRGVFGVPTFAVDERIFWGHDALPMLRAYLHGDQWFTSDAWNAVDRCEAYPAVASKSRTD